MSVDSRPGAARILYVQYTNPAGYPPLIHSATLLADAGWRVLFLGTDDSGGEVRFSRHAGISVRMMPFCGGGLFQKFHYAAYCAWVLACALCWRPACVYASDLLACPAGELLRRFGFRVVYHEHDAPDPAASKPAGGALLRARRSLARGAALCIVPNRARAEALVSAAGQAVREKTVFVANCPLKSEVRAPRAGLPEKTLTVLFQGSIVPSRLPFSVLEALALLPGKVLLKIVGYETAGSAGYCEALKRKAGDLGVLGSVDFIGTVPTREELFEQIVQCDVGLALMPSSGDWNERSMAGASNKPFDYLACGLAVLVSDLPEWKSMYVDAGCGLACDPGSASSIAEALAWFHQHPSQARDMGQRGRLRILEEWNYESQFQPVLERLGRLAGNGR